MISFRIDWFDLVVQRTLNDLIQHHSSKASILWHSAKESTCNAGDPGLIPELGRSPGEEIGYPLQYSWAFLMAQMVKNSPAVQETWVQSLGWEDALEEGVATHSSVLAWRIPGMGELHGLPSMGLHRVGHD